MDIGRRIQALRVKSGLSQESLSDRLGVTRQSVSKWELGQALPDTEKIIQLSRLFGVTTDWLLMDKGSMHTKSNNQSLRFGMYLIVKNFDKSVDFYEKLLNMGVSTVGKNRFAQFFFDGICISIMNESHLPGHDYSGCGDHKFVLNFWIADLFAEHKRIKSLNLGRVTEIIHPHSNYYFFNVYDPDGNVIEITGNYEPNEGD
ncbi:MAG: helix-turn-helix domain-containing protein [Defluviitaleaceae bacterium]|nr:helix-turn-helix domain-containing protein [Defluviitaleaceae bacterium]